MPTRSRSLNDIIPDLIRHAGQTTPLTRFTRGSKARSFYELFGAELVNHARSLEKQIRRTRPSSATQKELELIGDLFNLKRLRRRKAKAPMGDLNVRFFTDPPSTFGDLDSLPGITIGTVITTGGQNPIRYRVTQTPVGGINPTSSTFYVGVESQQSGAQVNVARNTLTSHSFGIDGLRVTNDFPIFNGRSDESDEQFRFRLFNAVRSLEAANDTAVFLAARIVPGVGDILTLNKLFGIGTMAVIIQPVTGAIVPPSIRASVQRAVGAVKPSSTDIFVSGPDVVGFELEIVVNYTKTVNATDKAIISRNIIRNLRRQFSQKQIGDPVSFTSIAAVANAADSRIKSLGETEDSLGRAWIYHSETFAETAAERRRSELMSTSESISLKNFEMAALEPSIGTPIRIVHGTEG